MTKKKNLKKIKKKEKNNNNFKLHLKCLIHNLSHIKIIFILKILILLISKIKIFSSNLNRSMEIILISILKHYNIMKI